MLTFSPCNFRAPYQMVDAYQVTSAFAAAKVGNWIYTAKDGADEEENKRIRKAAHEAITDAERRLSEVLAAGRLSAYVYLLAKDRFFRIPPEYWRDDEWWESRLHDGLYAGFGEERVPSDYAEQPVFLLEREVEQFLAFEQRAARGAKPRKTKYPWAAFEEEAQRQLDEEGDYRTDWRPADLQRRMVTWCEDRGWDKLPAESHIQEHISRAHEEFLRQRAEN